MRCEGAYGQRGDERIVTRDAGGADGDCDDNDC